MYSLCSQHHGHHGSNKEFQVLWPWHTSRHDASLSSLAAFVPELTAVSADAWMYDLQLYICYPLVVCVIVTSTIWGIKIAKTLLEFCNRPRRLLKNKLHDSKICFYMSVLLTHVRIYTEFLFLERKDVAIRYVYLSHGMLYTVSYVPHQKHLIHWLIWDYIPQTPSI
jgi:hypothetical protein